MALVMALAGCSRLVVLHDALSAAEHNDLGVAYEVAGDTVAAGREYRRALRREPRFARAMVNLGNLEARRGRWAAAERRFRSALREAPADPDALNNLAVVLLRANRRLEEAEWLARSAAMMAGERDSIPRATLVEVQAARRR